MKIANTALGTFAINCYKTPHVFCDHVHDLRDPRPNILFIMTDDHSVASISAYHGFLSEVMKTPNIDRLAEEGIRFDNCFCTNSICVPSRASILTGKYSHKNGCLTLDDKFDRNENTFPKLLQQAGYFTAVIGKWHLSTEPNGFHYYNVLPGQGEYFNPRLKEKGNLWRDAAGGGEVYQGYVTDIITDIVLNCLEKRPKEKPFCILYHHKAPHDNWEFNQKFSDLYEDISIPEPQNLFDDYANRSQAIRRATQKIGMKHTKFEKETMGLKEPQKKKKQYQIFIKRYLRCVASIDENVGRVLDYLDRSDLAENTIVVYASDQGFFLGEHGLYDKRFMYEESLRMPLIVRWPRNIKPHSINRDIVLNIDLAPTFIDIAGLKLSKDIQGISLKSILGSKTPPNWRKSMYYRYWMHGAHFNVPAHFGLRTERYKLIYYYGKPLNAKGAIPDPTPPEWEFFDLQKDPQEMYNAYGDYAYANIVTELKVKLIKLRRELEDDNDNVTIDF